MAPVFHRRAEIWRVADSLDKAIEEYDKALNLEEGTYYLSLRGCAICYMEQEKLKRALEDMLEGVRINPKSAKNLSLLAVLEDRVGNKKQARINMTKAFDLPTHSPVAYVHRAEMEFHEGKLQDSLNDLSQAIMLDPYFKEAFELRKTLNEKLGRMKEAESDRSESNKLIRHVEFFP